MSDIHDEWDRWDAWGIGLAESLRSRDAAYAQAIHDCQALLSALTMVVGAMSELTKIYAAAPVDPTLQAKAVFTLEGALTCIGQVRDHLEARPRRP
jgi:hypothetical protein